MLTHSELLAALPNCIDGTDFDHLGEKYQGKVRDVYNQGDRLILVTSDRVSAFDRVLGLIPYKGQVLTQLSGWWFERTQDLCANHLINSPHPNVMVTHKAKMLPVEVVVRGYITGVTDTSIWTQYANGNRTPYGVPLPDGLRKNDPLPDPIITPTTKAQQGEHDEPITEAEIVESGLIDADLWEEIRTKAIAVFQRGQELAAIGGLILVDTKYEFGMIDGELSLCDEIHTPDSSRFWLAESYDEARNPTNFSKEFMREWYAAQGYTGDGVPPIMPDDLRARIAQRYIDTYEKLTGKPFIPSAQSLLQWAA